VTSAGGCKRGRTTGSKHARTVAACRRRGRGSFVETVPVLNRIESAESSRIEDNVKALRRSLDTTSGLGAFSCAFGQTRAKLGRWRVRTPGEVQWLIR
jgi:hypothetical protein